MPPVWHCVTRQLNRLYFSCVLNYIEVILYYIAQGQGGRRWLIRCSCGHVTWMWRTRIPADQEVWENAAKWIVFIVKTVTNWIQFWNWVVLRDFWRCMDGYIHQVPDINQPEQWQVSAITSQPHSMRGFPSHVMTYEFLGDSPIQKVYIPVINDVTCSENNPGR